MVAMHDAPGRLRRSGTAPPPEPPRAAVLDPRISTRSTVPNHAPMLLQLLAEKCGTGNAIALIRTSIIICGRQYRYPSTRSSALV
eukprot:COSAG02_NODE_199_length_29529_cov_32.558289_14_plen_85_part_00